MLTQSYWFPEMIIQYFTKSGKTKTTLSHFSPLTSFNRDRGRGQQLATGVPGAPMVSVKHPGRIIDNCAGLGGLEPCTAGDYVV